jgi:hexosaminidase
MTAPPNTSLKKKIPSRLVFCMIVMSAPLYSTALAERPSPSIVPLPVKMIAGKGVFHISPKTRVIAEGKASAEAGKLIDALAPAMGFGLKRADDAKKVSGTITLTLAAGLAKTLGSEGYTLEVNVDRIEIKSAGAAGLFYGVQTLRQLLPAKVFSTKHVENMDWVVPCVSITGHPRFGWRGLLIDPARHFIPVDDVKRFIDAMALHKFNRLQMHLTDDQGWRIEIKKYPRLTEIGAWRDETLVGHMGAKPRRYDGKRHGGFYTQKEIRELVRYAEARHVTIVPEIEMPGHFRAVIAAYPALGVFPDRQKDLKPWTHWGISHDILAPRPAGVQFCKDVLTEVMALFPSRHIHIGGDEAKKTQWKQSEEIQKMIREKGLKNEEQLQAWFIKQIDAFLTANGRRLIGWDEILQGGLAPGATVMSWRGQRGGITAAKAGHDVVMAPVTHTYFDNYQGPRGKEPLAIGGNLPLAKVYRYEPIPKAITAKQARHVLGAQAQLWGEYISTPEHRQYMAYPRACALIEALWSPREARDYEPFIARLTEHLDRLAAAGIHYRKLDAAAK